MKMKIEAGSLAELNQWIPAWLGSLSLARGQIVVDQIHGLLARSARCSRFEVPSSGRSISSPLVFLVSTDSNGQKSAVLAAQSFSVTLSDPSGHLGAKGGATGILGDSATILHAGTWVEKPTERSVKKTAAASELNPLASAASIDHDSVPQPLVDALDRTLSLQGVKFLQWATDSGTDSDSGLANVCESFGMLPLATLEYLSVAIEKLTLDSFQLCSLRRCENELSEQTQIKSEDLDFVLIDEQDPKRNAAAFEALVSRTYKETLDCPALSQFRTASQTLSAYRDVDSYDPNRWYFVVAKDNPADPLGCVIFATHRDSRRVKDASKVETVPTSELVYMALLPEKRRQGFGRPLVKLALSEPAIHFRSQIGRVSSSPQVVLAVDQQNTHARQLYYDAGLRPMLFEKVWGKSVGDTLSTTT